MNHFYKGINNLYKDYAFMGVVFEFLEKLISLGLGLRKVGGGTVSSL